MFGIPDGDNHGSTVGMLQYRPGYSPDRGSVTLGLVAVCLGADKWVAESAHPVGCRYA